MNAEETADVRGRLHPRRQFNAPVFKFVQKLEDKTSREIRKSSRRHKLVSKIKRKLLSLFFLLFFCFTLRSGVLSPALKSLLRSLIPYVGSQNGVHCCGGCVAKQKEAP